MDSIIVDLEHGAVDFGSVFAMIASTPGTDCAPLVRIAENDEAQVKRALNLGAEGIVFPLIRNAGDAERAVPACAIRQAARGFGPFLAHSRCRRCRHRPTARGTIGCWQAFDMLWLKAKCGELSGWASQSLRDT